MNQQQKLKPLYLKKNEDSRISSGHLWVYSNEVDVIRSPMKNFESGDNVCVLNSENKPLGSAIFNPHSLICARIYSTKANVFLNQEFITQKLSEAFMLRKIFYFGFGSTNTNDANYYRLCFSEADFLPGLIIDRFDDVVVVMITTAGMEKCKPLIIKAIKNVLDIDKIIIRNDSPFRLLEELTIYTENIGDIPEFLSVSEANLKFKIPSQNGQKSGWFYDQRANRDLVIPHLKNKKVLDVFSYMGAWSLRALSEGATSSVCVDISKTALNTIKINARLNGLSDGNDGRNDLQSKLTLIEGDAFSVLKQLIANGNKFDAVIVDPPAFIKRKKDFKQGFDGYKRINQLAMSLLNNNGLLISLSCSQHLSYDQLKSALTKASKSANINLQQVKILSQSPDHPILPGMSENQYLKGFMFLATKINQTSTETSEQKNRESNE